MANYDIKLLRECCRAEPGDIALATFDRDDPEGRFQHVGLVYQNAIIVDEQVDCLLLVLEKIETLGVSEWGPCHKSYRADVIGKRDGLDPLRREELLALADSWRDRFLTADKQDRCNCWGLRKPPRTWSLDKGPPPIKMSCATFVEWLFEQIGLDIVDDGDDCEHLPLWPSPLAYVETTSTDSNSSRQVRRLFPGYQFQALEYGNHAFRPSDFKFAVYPRDFNDHERWYGRRIEAPRHQMDAPADRRASCRSKEEK